MLLVIQDSSLRPIPGPDPVVLPSYDWLLWLIPVILIGFLWYWWSRKPGKRQPDELDRLYQSLEHAADLEVESKTRFQQLHQALRDYLTYLDPAWKSITASEAKPLWQQLLPDDNELANQAHELWVVAETVVFSPGSISENQVAGYSLLIQKLDAELNYKAEKTRKNEKRVPDRNKTGVESE